MACSIEAYPPSYRSARSLDDFLFCLFMSIEIIRVFSLRTSRRFVDPVRARVRQLEAALRGDLAREALRDARTDVVDLIMANILN